MRYAIFSDIHSNLEALEAVLVAYEKEAIDAYLCVGDIVGYGADPQACIDKIKSLKAVTVCGNHDWASVDLFSMDDFNPIAQEAILWTKKHLRDSDKTFLQSLNLVYKSENFVLVHGSLENPQNFSYILNVIDTAKTFQLLDANICFIGHTHVPVVFVRDKLGNCNYEDVNALKILPENKYIVNVGSVGQPRDSNYYAGYCIFDTQTQEIQIRRVKYDVLKARRKIVEAGLAPFLGDRLLTGN